MGVVYIPHQTHRQVIGRSLSVSPSLPLAAWWSLRAMVYTCGLGAKSRPGWSHRWRVLLYWSACIPRACSVRADVCIPLGALSEGSVLGCCWVGITCGEKCTVYLVVPCLFHCLMLFEKRRCGEVNANGKVVPPFSVFGMILCGDHPSIIV